MRLHSLAAWSLVSVGALLGAGCSGSSAGAGGVVGQILDESGNPLSGATVTSPSTGSSTTSALTGSYDLANPGTGEVLLKFSAPGYGNVVRRVTIDPAVDYSLTVRLAKRPAAVSIDSAVGGRVAQAFASVNLVADAFCTESGAPVSGKIDFTVVPYDALNPDVAPSDLRTNDGLELISAGMVDLIAEQGGQPLKLCKTGSTLTMREPSFVKTANGTWNHYVLGADGLWDQVGTATGDANGDWTVPLDQLGPHNDDWPAPNPATISGKLKDAFGVAVTSKTVKLKSNASGGSQREDSTDSTGSYSVSLPLVFATGNPSMPPESVTFSTTASELTDASGKVWQRIIDAPDTFNVTNGGSVTKDYNYCIVSGAKCKVGASLGSCCAGTSCNDGFCN